MPVDVEAGVRDYLRASTAVQAIQANRCWFGIPDRVEYPMTVVSRVGGGADLSEVPIDQALLQLDCRADTKADAFELTSAVCAELEAIRTATPLNDQVVAYGVGIESVIWLPDPSDKPRYVVTAAVTARAA